MVLYCDEDWYEWYDKSWYSLLHRTSWNLKACRWTKGLSYLSCSSSITLQENNILVKIKEYYRKQIFFTLVVDYLLYCRPNSINLVLFTGSFFLAIQNCKRVGNNVLRNQVELNSYIFRLTWFFVCLKYHKIRHNLLNEKCK